MKRLKFLAIALVTSSLLTACKREPQKPATGGPDVQRVKVAKVTRALFADEVEALGTVKALESINLAANVTETVTALHFEDGEVVKKGQLLVNLNDTEERATLAAAEAQLAEPMREAERLRALVKGGAVSEVRLQGYETQIEIARRKIEEIEAQIADRRLEAPFDGVLGFRRISLGALVSPDDVITTLDVMSSVKYDFTVPETFLSDLRIGLEMVAHSDAWPGVEFRGKVTRIDSRVNPVTRSVTVRSEIPNEDLKLRPGMLMTTVLAKNPTRSLSVPERSLVALQRQQFLFVVEEGDGAEIARRVPVETGRRQPGIVEVLSGIEEGQAVITDGLLGIRDGAAVQVSGEFTGSSQPYTPGN